MANGSSSSSLPDEIVQAIAISNAKSIGEQPAILANLALANQILNNNLQQQMFISNQQAMNQIVMATMAKCVTLIAGGDSSGDQGTVKELLDILKAMNPGQKPPNPPH
jgi:polyphosphate kinase 2 (PPK2 family)